MTEPKNPSTKSALLISGAAAFIASLCCFSPLVIVLFGLGSVTLAGSLADTLYGEYKWYFRLSGVILLALAYLYWYSRSSQNCSLDQKKRLRRKFLNLFLLSLFSFIGLYLIWLYGIVELWGVYYGIWELPYWFGGP